MKLSLVIPVYNSEEILPELITQIDKALHDHTYEVVLVNDGSADGSWRVMEALGDKYCHVKSVCLARNFGQDNAIMCGLNHAKGEYIVIMDDDLQHSPHDIPKLMEKCDEGYDVCYADYSGGMRQAWWKNFGSYLNSKQAELFLSKPREIYLSPFKMIRRSVVDSIIEYKGPYPYVDGLIFRSTSSIAQVPVEHHKRFASKSNYNLRKSISVFLKHLTGFSIVPLRVASLMGALLTAAGLILIAIYTYYYFKGDTVEGWTTLVLILLTLGGAILMSLGIIGEYIGRLYLLASNRPQYTIRKVKL